MDENRKVPASPAAGIPPNALNAISPNQQRYDLDGAVKTRLFGQDERRDSTVQERAARFDQLANSGRSQQQKSMEASLKRAMVGLEEAERMKKKYLAEATSAKMDMQLMETKMKKIAHRHEDALEYIARMKESHAHAVETKDKDIQRYRKTHTEHQLKFKQLGDKYQHTKSEFMKTKNELDEEKQRSAAREQEAFESRSQLSTLQEELAAAIEKIKVAEQERDAFKAAAKSEEVARIAAEGRIPLPKAKEEDDEFKSPRKASAPLPKVDIVSSEASMEEIEQLMDALEQERYRAESAFDLVDFLTLECQFKCCSCRRGAMSEINYVHDLKAASKPVNTAPAPSPSPDMMEDIEMGGVESNDDAMEVDTTAPETNLNRTSTIFVPSEGIFRTVPSRSQQQQAPPPPAQHKSTRYSTEQMPPPPFTNTREINNRESTSSRQCRRQSPTHDRAQARTPSAEPPTFANNNLLPTDASIISFVSPANSTAPSPTTNQNQFRAPSRQQYQENQSMFRKEQNGQQHGGQHFQQQQSENVIFQHHIHHPSDKVHPADLAAGRFEYREEDTGVGQESREKKIQREHRADGEAGGDVVMGDAPAPPFSHHLHSRNEPVRHEQVHQPMRSEPVRRENMVDERRPMAPPPKRSYENQPPREHREHHQPQHHSHHKYERPEHNFRTISTTTKIAIKPEEDDDIRTPLSGISHHSGAGFGLQRSGSTLSASSEPTISSSNLPVSREEALAMIRERRGRARSLHEEKEGGNGRDKSRPPTRQEAPKTPKRDIEIGPAKSTCQRNARSVSRGRLYGL